MADVTGVKVTDLTAAGSSDDGEHVWITHRLGDGSEYPLVYPYEAVGYLITVLTDAAPFAGRRRRRQTAATSSSLSIRRSPRGCRSASMSSEISTSGSS